MTRANRDLVRHAADKVSRALRDVCDLEFDPSAKSQIAMMAAGVCIGAAAGYLRGAVERAGGKCSEGEAFLQVLDLLKTISTEGADAAMAKMAENSR